MKISKHVYFGCIIIGSLATGLAVAYQQYGWAIFNVVTVVANIYNYFSKE